MTDDDRTAPLGLFNYARRHFAPSHAIELYLRLSERLRGLGIDEVRDSFGHDYKKLVNEAGSRGLDLMDEDMDIAATSGDFQK